MRVLILLFAAACAWAQSDGISTSASRTVTIPADEARFAVDVTTAFATSLEQVLQALNGTGIQASDLVGQRVVAGQTSLSLQPFPPSGVLTPRQLLSMVYSFAFTRPVGELKTLGPKLAALQETPPTGYTLQYGAATGPSAAAVEEMRRTTLPGLIADARRKAQALASAANLVLGPIRSIADGSDIGFAAAYISTQSISSEFRTSYSISVRFAAQ